MVKDICLYPAGTSLPSIYTHWLSFSYHGPFHDNLHRGTRRLLLGCCKPTVFSRLNKQSSLSLPSHGMYSIQPILVALQWMHCTFINVIISTWYTKLGVIFQMLSDKCCVEGKQYFPWSICYAAVNTIQETVGLLCCWGTLLTHIGLEFTRISRPFLAELLARQSVPSLYWCRGLFLSTYKILHMSLLNFTGFL